MAHSFLPPRIWCCHAIATPPPNSAQKRSGVVPSSFRALSTDSPLLNYSVTFLAYWTSQTHYPTPVLEAHHTLQKLFDSVALLQ